MQRLAQKTYTADQVKAALHSPTRRLTFTYEILDADSNQVGWCTSMMAATVKHEALADIKRTAKFTLVDKGEVDFNRHRIRPWVQLWMTDTDYVEWPQGVFILTTPPRKTDYTGRVICEVEAYDLGHIMRVYRVSERYTVAASSYYITDVRTILEAAGIPVTNLTWTTKVTPAALDWPMGTSGGQIINNLLSAINYQSLWFDGIGAAIARPYISPQDRAPQYTYAADSLSVIYPEVEQTLDLFDIPNSWVGYTSDADNPSLRSTYTNENPASPTSTVTRGYTYVAEPMQLEAASQEDLDAELQRIAFEASQVYEHVKFETALMPIHEHADIITLTFSPLNLAAKYSEVSWEMELKPGGKMQHEVRRVVEV